MRTSGAATSIVQLLAHARRRRTLRSALESTALGLAAAGAGVAAALISGTAASQRITLLACGLLCGACMAATWWVERAKLSDLGLARRIDQALGADGALATAFELRLRGGVGSLALLLERRVLTAVDPGRLRAAQPAAGWIWLAPPAAGAALVAMALELPGLSPSEPRVPAGLGYGSSRPSASQRAREALERVSAAMATDPSAAENRRDELQAALEALGPQGRRNLEAGESAAAADELASRLGAALARISSTPPTGDQPPARAAGQAVGAAAGEASDSGLVIGSAERTMAGSNRAEALPVVPEPVSLVPIPGAADEAGTLAGRWWPERYDPVIQGWRQALAARGQVR